MATVNATSTICSNNPVNITLNSPTSGAVITLNSVTYGAVVGTIITPKTSASSAHSTNSTGL